MHSFSVRTRRPALALILATTALVVGAGPVATANAGLLGGVLELLDGPEHEPPPVDPDSPGPQICGSPILDRVFSAFGDDRDYALAPGGSFERTPFGWSLGRSEVRRGNEPWYVGSRYDRSSLRIARGATVTSAPMCVDLDHPTFRFFADSPGLLSGLLSSGNRLQIDVVYADAKGSPSAPVGWITARSAWQVTEDIAVLPELGGEDPGWRLVRFRFTALDGDVRIDDLYVDPRKSG